MAATPQQRQEFGLLLRSLREGKGLSQRRLAQAVTEQGTEVTDRSVSGWERGTFAPDRRFLLHLEKVLGAEGALLAVLGLDDRGEGRDRLSLIEERLAAVERWIEDQREPMATVRALPAHEDPDEFAAAAEGDQEERGAGPTPGRGPRPRRR